MSLDFSISIDDLRSELDDALETATFSAVSIFLGGRSLTRCFGRSTGERDYVKIALHALAAGIARNWWAMLYEPHRNFDGAADVGARHRLDAYVAGFAFPGVGVWSAGDEAVSVELSPGQLELRWRSSRKPTQVDREINALFPDASSEDPRRLSPVGFAEQGPIREWLPRTVVENELFKLVTHVVERLASFKIADDALTERWDAVISAMNDPELRNYCMAAGRLGLDPYDPDGPDLSVFAAEIPEDSFDDLCEAVLLSELPDAASWVAQHQEELMAGVRVDLSQLGSPPILSFGLPGYQSGYRSAMLMRSELGLPDDPKKVSRELFGTNQGRADLPPGPPAVEGLAARPNGVLHTRVVSRSVPQRRFQLYRSLFLGWEAGTDSYPLVTTGSTLRQQASRAFAAEMLCPAEYLRHVAGPSGLTTDRIAEISQSLECPFGVVRHQAENHGIPLRGVY